MAKNIIAKFKNRADTSTNWAIANPILELGELGLETDTNKIKFGDGVTTWNSLVYYSYVSDAEKASWNSKGVVDLGIFNDEYELITHVLVNQLPTGQYAFLMNGFSYLMLLRDWGEYYNGILQDNVGIHTFFEVTKTGEINELTHINIRNINLMDMQILELYSQVSNKVNVEHGKGLSSNDYTTAEKTKLFGISTGANNYTHPSTHPASMITGLPTSLPANGGNADTVGGFTVGVDVPANAKFTDANTTYSVISTTEIDTGTATSSRVISAQRLKYISDKLKITVGATQPTNGWWFKEI